MYKIEEITDIDIAVEEIKALCEIITAYSADRDYGMACPAGADVLHRTSLGIGHISTMLSELEKGIHALDKLEG